MTKFRNMTAYPKPTPCWLCDWGISRLVNTETGESLHELPEPGGVHPCKHPREDFRPTLTVSEQAALRSIDSKFRFWGWVMVAMIMTAVAGKMWGVIP